MVTPNDHLKDAEHRMAGAHEALRRELAAIRTGRASTELVEHIVVEYYGTETPLNQIASVTVAEARVLAIQPWDKGAMAAVEKAIQMSDIGITPNNDGSIIRLTLPLLTEERRKELVRLVRKKVEDGRVEVRNIRRDILEQLRAMGKDKDISQDESKRAQEQLQKITDQYVGEMDALGVEKEKEVMEV